MIRTRDLAKSYGGRRVLRGVSLEVARGEIFGFVGPNGAGKTTFLKCLIGAARPDGGSAEVAGCNCLTESVELRRRVGYCPGETALYYRMRAVEFLDFAIAFHPTADRRRAAELLDLFDLPPRQRIGGFSHGMKRKLLLAQALACGAPVLLLDEPMEGLDPEARRQVEELLRGDARRGVTIFFSSHDLPSVQRICDRVAFLRAGQILESGGVGELLERAGKLLSLTLRAAVPESELPGGGDLRWSGHGTKWRLEFRGSLEQLLPRLSRLPLAGIRDASGGLEEVFDALYGPAAGDGNPP